MRMPGACRAHFSEIQEHPCIYSSQWKKRCFCARIESQACSIVFMVAADLLPVVAHGTVTPALQGVARLVRTSPLAAVVTLPRTTAERRILTLYDRYPSAAADHLTRSSLRHLRQPAVSLIVMPPEQDTVAVLLLTNVVPDDREVWTPALDPAYPLRWRAYELATGATMAQASHGALQPSAARLKSITWRLAAERRDNYRQTITRLIHSATPSTKTFKNPAQCTARRTPAGARDALERLGTHLVRYPGLSGIRTDVWLLGHHMYRLWNQQLPKEPAPSWPRHRYSTLLAAQFAPLESLWIPLEDTA